jgi:hypothetical protein
MTNSNLHPVFKEILDNKLSMYSVSNSLRYSEREVDFISSNTAIVYERLLAAGLSEIPVHNSEAVWVQNANFPNNYILEKKDYIMGKSWFHDKTKIRIFGWTEEVMYGDKKGMIEATIPITPDEDDENSSNCEIIGYFDSVASAMANIIERNHPDYGIWI